MRLRGKGIKRVNGFGHGDHYVHIKIKVPSSLTPQQEALIRGIIGAAHSLILKRVLKCVIFMFFVQ